MKLGYRNEMQLYVIYNYRASCKSRDNFLNAPQVRRNHVVGLAVPVTIIATATYPQLYRNNHVDN